MLCHESSLHRDDLSPSEKALLARYADQLKQQAQLAIPKRRKR